MDPSQKLFSVNGPIESFSSGSNVLNTIPPAKTPKQIFIVPDLPKNDRGKVLREKLREDWAAQMKVPR